MLLAVTAIGADRPGIVAAVTKVLLDKGCNLEDTSMTILRGHFAMMLVVAGPDAASLEAALDPVARDLDLVVAVREIAPEPGEPEPARPHVVSVYGADKPGIVHHVAALLAARNVNITDLTTRLVGDEDPLYAMILEVDLPEGASVEELRDALSRLAATLEVDATLRAADPDIL